MALSLFIGLLFACSFGLNRINRGSFPDDWIRKGIIDFVVFGSSSMVIQFFVSRMVYAHTPAAPDLPTGRWKWFIHFFQTVHIKLVLIIAGVIGLSAGLSTGLIVGLNHGLTYGVTYGLDYGSIVGLSFGLSYALVALILRAQTGNIHLTERLRWTKNSLSRSLFLSNRLRILGPLTSSIILFVGLSYGLSNGLSFGLSAGLSYGLSVGLIYWLLSGLLQGIAQERIEDQDRRVPNEGIQRSLRNSIMTGIISGGIIGVISTLSLVAVSVLSYGLSFGLSRGLSFGLSHGLSFGLGNGPQVGLFGGLLVCMSMGGLAVWRHYVIRFLLWRTHTFPRRAPQFLDDACARFLLRRVGGGYSFMHRLLLDYFVE
jgi:hypothetical protein